MLHLGLKQIATEQKIDGFATECWSGFPPKLGMNPCLGFVDDSYTLACEGDVMLCVSLLMVRYMIGTSAYVGDLYDLDIDNILTFIHCGAPASLAANPANVEIVESQLAVERGFETMNCRPWLEPGRVTIFRFYGRNCDKMHIASGDLLSCDLSKNMTVQVRLDGNRWDFLRECLGNHYIVVAGDIRKELEQLCKWYGITVY
jgi:L-fucose isomerase-like protein